MLILKFTKFHFSTFYKPIIRPLIFIRGIDFGPYYGNYRRRDHHLPLYLIHVQFKSENYKLTWVFNGNYIGFLTMREHEGCTLEEILRVASEDFVDIPDKVPVFVHDDLGKIIKKEKREVRPYDIVKRLATEECRVVDQIWRRRWWQGGSFHRDDLWPWNW